MRDMIILPQHEGKGRSFQAMRLASVVADPLWEGGSAKTDAIRPVWALFAGSEDELRPFIANLTLGRKASYVMPDHGYKSRPDGVMEFLKSARYQVTWQHEKKASTATLFLPDLFHMDPGMVDTEGIRFVLMPSLQWLEDQKLDRRTAARYAAKINTKADKETLASLVPMAYLFAAYLDRRTRCPIPADGRFHLQLLLACLQNKLASWPMPDRSYDEPGFGVHRTSGLEAVDVDTWGYCRPIVFQSSHAEFEQLLADEVAMFFDRIQGV